MRVTPGIDVDHHGGTAGEGMSDWRRAMAHEGEGPTPRPGAPASALPSDASAPSRRPPAAEMVRLYASPWAAFVSWCHAAARAPLLADPDTVTAYLLSLADTPSYGSLMRRLAAIADQHRQHRLAAPAIDPAARALLREVRRWTSQRPLAPTSLGLAGSASNH
jgi:hypothetical protein